MSNYIQQSPFGMQGYPPNSGYPSNSGPPPPPGGSGAYGYNYGQPQAQYNYGQSAYNTGAYGVGGYGANVYGGYQLGSAPPPGGQHGMTGGYSGMQDFTQPPAFQQCAQMYQGQPPANFQGAPPSRQIDMLVQANYQKQMQMQQMMLNQVRAEKPEKKRRRKRRQAEEDEDEEEEEEEEEEEDDGKISESVKQTLKKTYVNELERLQNCFGTFEMTSGTVKPFLKYGTSDVDPVTAFHETHEDVTDIAGSDWSAEYDGMFYRYTMKGWGTNDDGLIHVASTRCNRQRNETMIYYKTAYGRDLIEDIIADTSGDYRKCLVALFETPARYDAYAIKDAIYGLGTNERTLIEIFMTRTNAQIQEMNSQYKSVVNTKAKKSKGALERDIEGDCSGDFKRLLISASMGNRKLITRAQLEECTKEKMIDGVGLGIFELDEIALADQEKAKRDAKKLLKAGEDRWGTDEETFIRIFATSSMVQLKATWNEYVKLTQRDILNSIDRETSGNFRKGLQTIVQCIRYKPAYFADRLIGAMKGLGTNEEDLIRIIISRSEIDLVEIKKAFLDITNKTLYKWLEEDCSYNFRKLLQAIVQKN